MSQVQQTADEVTDSLTGHEEMAILQHFGRTISDLVGDHSMLRRALVFVLKKREGANEDDARNAALEMTLKSVLEHFSEVSAESGKGRPRRKPQPKPSPPGASEPADPETST